MSKKNIVNQQGRKPQKPKQAGQNKAGGKPVSKNNNLWYANPFILAGIIAAVTFLLFLPALQNGFVYDDEIYAVNNPLLADLSFSGIKNIFSQYYFGNYHPLTILSLAIDYNIFGTGAAGFHFTNIFLHSIAVFFVFIFVYKLSSSAPASIVAALLFGISPLHVESAAWISSRKDLLYGLFFVLSLIFYLKYKFPSFEKVEKNISPFEKVEKNISPFEKGGLRGISQNSNKEQNSSNNNLFFYIISLIFFIFSCLSKAMGVMLPVILILIDILQNKKLSIKLLIDKIPFFVVSLVLGLIAIDAQSALGGIKESPAAPIFDKIILWLYGIFFYIYKMAIPTGMSANYSAPIEQGGGLQPIAYIGAFVIILSIFLIIYYYKKTKIPAFSFLFYFFCILPVLQILPIGNAFTADRFSYLSSIGIIYAAGTGFAFLFKFKKIQSAATITVLIILIIFGYLA
ncbi:MAG: protein O-mannosyl-transferase, partial [Bacteroidota bacterium]|nr:protein O-mannosyl-transferase [Bacteroidota bacterium]